MLGLFVVITVAVFAGITLARGHANNPEISVRIRRGIGNTIVYVTFALFALFALSAIFPRAFE